MTTVTQLDKLLWLSTPKGLATCLFVTDRGPEADLEWTCIIHEGEAINQLWTFTNLEVRAVKNVTLGRVPKPYVKDFIESELDRGSNIIDQGGPGCAS